MTAILDRAAILAAADREKVRVNIPEWGGDVWVQAFSVRHREIIESRFFKGDRVEMDGTGRALVATMTVVDDNGNALFTEADVDALASKSFSACQRIWEAAIRISGMGAQAVEDAEKN